MYQQLLRCIITQLHQIVLIEISINYGVGHQLSKLFTKQVYLAQHLLLTKYYYLVSGYLKL